MLLTQTHLLDSGHTISEVSTSFLHRTFKLAAYASKRLLRVVKLVWAKAGTGKMQTCGPADLRTGQRVICRPSLRTRSAIYPPVGVAYRCYRKLYWDT